MKKAKLYMDTVVEIKIVTQDSEKATIERLDQAFDMFKKVEHACSRFTRESELMRACEVIGKPVKVSPYLFEPLKFALELAKWTGGIFDPTIGRLLEQQGFNRHYLTGNRMESQAGEFVSYKDIILDEQNKTLLIQKPLVIDLGAVAKGFAIDLAAHELIDVDGFLVNAGGDIYAGGFDVEGCPWKIGIQHPFQKEKVIETLEVTNQAVCTSGSYERVNALGNHHIINPRTKHSSNHWISCSVLAPFAMMADGFSTLAFLMDKNNGSKFMEEVDLQGVFLTPDLQLVRVGGI